MVVNDLSHHEPQHLAYTCFDDDDEHDDDDEGGVDNGGGGYHGGCGDGHVLEFPDVQDWPY